MSNLTRDEILVMTAGEEMDALIAQRIFKRPGVSYYGPTAHGTKHTDYEMMTKGEAHAAYLRLWTGEKKGTRAWADADYGTLRPCWWQAGWGPMAVDEYSTDIAAAWEVVEEMTRQGRFVEVGSVRGGWYCDVVMGTPWPIAAPTPSLAICRAALLTRLREEE